MAIYTMAILNNPIAVPSLFSCWGSTLCFPKHPPKPRNIGDQVTVKERRQARQAEFRLPMVVTGRVTTGKNERNQGGFILKHVNLTNEIGDWSIFIWSFNGLILSSRGKPSICFADICWLYFFDLFWPIPQRLREPCFPLWNVCLNG